jgi:ParB family chromosome partitioning protein
MAKKLSLGKGFDVLIPKDIDQSILEEDKHRVQKILIEDIKANPDQPRREFDLSALNELARSIKRHGVLQPIIVVRDNGAYRIVAGERRWRAAKAADLSHVPAIVRSLEELEQIELALIENVQRVDLSPLEQALSVYRLQQQFNLSLESIAEKLGKAPSTVSNLTRLLNLPEAAREALRSGKISEGHARAILALKNKTELQDELLGCILNNRWTVRQAEQFVVSAKKDPSASKARGNTQSENELTKQLSGQLGAPVKIKHTAKGGQLIIRFDSDDELKRLSGIIQKH